MAVVNAHISEVPPGQPFEQALWVGFLWLFIFTWNIVLVHHIEWGQGKFAPRRFHWVSVFN